VFGEMPISMVRAGGEGGFLEEVLTRVAQFTETQDDIKRRTMGAVAYPMFLAVVGVAVVTVLIVFFVPKFEELFGRMREKGELPAATEWVLAISEIVRHHGFLLLGGLAGLVVLVYVVMDTEQGQLWWDRVRIRLPLAGPILLHLAVARFCRVLGTLLRNGVPIVRSLEISSDATANRVLAVAIREATENISAGQPLATPLGASGHFPDLVVEMIAVAEQANNLEAVLLDIADSMERRTWRRLELAVRLLEPIMLLMLAAVVLLVVIALLLPVLKMSSAL
jgi:general secretion pathway protein F/type IV pilus assembly protein PilC